MSWITLSNRKVKTKKDHCCHGCNIKYPIGTTMNRNVSVDGHISTSYWCLICEEFMTDLWGDLDDEGLGEGDIWQYERPNYKEFRELKLNQNARKSE